MKFVIKGPFKENVYNLIREVGYRFQGKNEERKELSFIRSLGGSDYSRFHLYLKVNSEINEIIFNLHLDQKRPIYKGVPAHSAEYESEIVKNEAERIKQILSNAKN